MPFLLFLAFSLFLAGSPEPSSCFCGERPSVGEEVMVKPRIFSGLVFSADTLELVDSVSLNQYLASPDVVREMNRTHFKVVQYTVSADVFYKGGAIADSLTLVYGPAESIDCPANIVVGKQHIFYADTTRTWSESTGAFFPGKGLINYTTGCSRTRIRNASEIKKIKQALQ